VVEVECATVANLLVQQETNIQPQRVPGARCHSAACQLSFQNNAEIIT
jgi:hypothetical protein